MKCESLALNKYLDKSQNIFFLYGSEVVLRNNSKNILKKYLDTKGFYERRIITKEHFDQIEQTIIESLNGSLFSSKLIIDIYHDQGKMPDQIIKIFEIDNISNNENIAIIINSHNEKLNSANKWVKKIDQHALIVECKKLKSFEEKIWLKNQLAFIDDSDKKKFIQSIYEMNVGNLVAQQNEVDILRLIYKSGMEVSGIFTNDSAEFIPFELEDEVIACNTSRALRIINTIKESEAHYAPLLVWIIGKVVNNSTAAKQNSNPQLSLQKSGVWSNKISSYIDFMRLHSLQKLIDLQKNIYELDLTTKGLSKRNFWNDLDNIIIKMTSS
ncbi:MAG: DNA-directed DNA polymerase [Proteobacteria bacterium]|nr:DNA-directed DNA polymerase [Pseudomonadota bacterium]MDA0949449.1 DNA-directed DNA polymerase [Pseudomonadota bacterium]